MNLNILFVVVLLVIALIILVAFHYFISNTHETFAMNTVCSGGLAEILKRSMELMDGDNSLPAEITSNKCIDTNDFIKKTDTGLMSNSSVLTVLFNLFQSTDNGVPYIDKFFDWKYKVAGGSLVAVDWSARLDPNGTTQFQNTVSLLGQTVIPMIINVRRIFTDIASSTDMSAKYNMSVNSGNRAFINGFLAKYKTFDESSASRLRTAGTEENAMFKSLTDRIEYRDPIITSNSLKNAMKTFAFAYLFNVNYTAAAQCNVSIMDTSADNDIKLYARLKKLLDMWRNMNKTGSVAFTATDLNGSMFQSAGDYSKSAVIKFFTEELKKPLPTGSIMTVEDHVANILNTMINNTFITDGGINDGQLINDPECKSDVGKLLCDLRLADTRICKPNMSACAGSIEFNQYCTAIGEVLKSAADPAITLPVLDLNNLPTTPTTPPTTPPAGTTTPPAGTTTPPAGTTTPPAGTTTPPAGTTAPPAGTTAPPAGTTTPPAGTTTPMAGSASNQEYKNKITQYAVPAYLDRSTQELLIFVYDKLAASYNFDDDEVPDDIKQAISQLPPSGKANLCARYCPLTMRCNAVCRLAGCLNCQVGTGFQAGSEELGAASTTLGYAGVDDDYNLLGFLDDISQSKLLSGSSSSAGQTSSNGKDQYRHMGPMISQKDTSGVSNIFAPYIIMAPKKDGTEYGAYLLDDPNDPNYRQYIDDLVKSY